jgi:sirohydrochlorin cobaltochelatase
MKPESAIVLFAHGARDVRWALPLERLGAVVQRSCPRARIAIAFLELQEPRLPQTLAALAAEGVTRIDIAPIFWSTGGHIARDLPALVAAFRTDFPQIAVRVLPVLAELAGMDDFVAQAIRRQVDAAADGVAVPAAGPGTAA